MIVHDLMKCHVATAPHLSHLVEVEVIEGPQKYLGKKLILPFDNYEAAERTPPRQAVCRSFRRCGCARPQCPRLPNLLAKHQAHMSREIGGT